MDATVLAALGESNRLRIVELVAEAPRSVGEIAVLLGLRQPQVTKHVQTLDRAGLVEVSTLGRRRLVALRRDAFAEVGAWLTALAVPGPDDDALARYGAAVAAASADPVTVRRVVPASPTGVWRAFTDPALAALWWRPRHFEVASFRFDTRPGGEVELVLREGDGAEHRAVGRVHALDRPRRLGFTLDPLGPDGTALFTARHDVTLRTTSGGTDVVVTVTPSDVREGAAAALGGLGIGWEQLLDALATLAGAGGLGRARGARAGVAQVGDGTP